VDDVRAHAAANAAYYDGLERRLRASRQAWLDVAYEDLEDAGEHARILAFLDVREPWPLRALTRRQNGAPLRDLLTDYDALAEALRGTPFARELAEP
jgi:hypothetical protein